MIYIDLFSGCGGLSYGLSKSGHSCMLSIEKGKDAFATYLRNLHNDISQELWPSWLSVEPHDARDVLSNFSTQIRKLRGVVDMIVGGPPCQGFSLAGKRYHDDERNGMVEVYLKYVQLIQPKVVFFENVKGINAPFKGDESKKSYADVIKERLKAMNYLVNDRIIDFSNFGIPQRRKRFIVIGLRADIGITPDDLLTCIDAESSKFLSQKGIRRNVSLRDAISDLLYSNIQCPTPDRVGYYSGSYGKVDSDYQRLMRDGTNQCVPNSHSYAKHSEAVISRFASCLDLGISNRNIASLVSDKHRNNKRTQFVLSPDLPSPTITTLPDDYIHYSEPRILTVREMARIQSFPDCFHFEGKYTTGGKLRKLETPRYTQVGNAVPPLFAELFGCCLAKVVE